MFNYIIYRIGEFLAMVLPLKFGYFVAGIISTLQYLLSFKDKNAVSNNLQVVLPDTDKGALKQYTKEVFINFGRYLVDFFRAGSIDRSYIRNNITVEGLDRLDAALAKGRGVIVVSAHIGNWELGGAILGNLGYKVNAIALPHKHKKVDAFFNRQREFNGMQVIPLGKAVKSSMEVFKRNEILCIVGDRDFTSGGMVIDFFGRPAMIPKGPAAFSLKHDVPIVAGFMVRVSKYKLCLFFNEPIDFKPTGGYNSDAHKLAEVYLSQIEDCIRRYPNQWYAFRRFWL